MIKLTKKHLLPILFLIIGIVIGLIAPSLYPKHSFESEYGFYPDSSDIETQAKVINHLVELRIQLANTRREMRCYPYCGPKVIDNLIEKEGLLHERIERATDLAISNGYKI